MLTISDMVVQKSILKYFENTSGQIVLNQPLKIIFE